jgi:hypothetical protein
VIPHCVAVSQLFSHSVSLSVSQSHLPSGSSQCERMQKGVELFVVRFYFFKRSPVDITYSAWRQREKSTLWLRLNCTIINQLAYSYFAFPLDTSFLYSGVYIEWKALHRFGWTSDLLFSSTDGWSLCSQWKARCGLAPGLGTAWELVKRSRERLAPGQAEWTGELSRVSRAHGGRRNGQAW